jgi:hypothetical protein
MGQSAYSNYAGGFQNGLLLRGVPIVQTNPGKVVWVYNGTTTQPGQIAGSNGNNGTFNKPYATIAYALTQCTANRGDIIIVRPGHAETIADAATLALNVAGVAIIGLGAGSLRPTLTFTTATTANIPVTAANMSIQNFLFVANFANIASFFTATGTSTPTDFNVEGCEFKDTSSILNCLTVFTGNATANSCDGLRLVSNRISSLGTTAATTAVKLSSATDRATMTDNFGCWAVLNDTAAMLAAGANNMTNFEFGRNRLERPNTSSTGGSFVSTSGTAWTGHAYDNYMYQLDNTAGIWIATGTGGAFGFTQNFSPITAAVDKSALVNPAAV